MEQRIKELTRDAQARIGGAADAAELRELRVSVLGKNGSLTELLRNMKDVEPSARPLIGKAVNDARTELEAAFAAREAEVEKAELESRLKNEKIDITIPVKRGTGGLHPLSVVKGEVTDFFVSTGFTVADGPEIETDYYNFQALNIPADHPARDAQDTFYINEKLLLRTQTSAGQIRTMEKRKPPIKMISPGRVYRADEPDATHSPVFHQIEGLVVDKGVTMRDLMGVLDAFAAAFFGEGTKTRFRPSFFPFTEPSVEVDATCAQCGGAGCRVCKGTGWIEIIGAGMVNRKVLSNCGINPDEYTGFAFGMGLDRITAIKYSITDLRVMFENDVRFLRQFS